MSGLRFNKRALAMAPALIALAACGTFPKLQVRVLDRDDEASERVQSASRQRNGHRDETSVEMLRRGNSDAGAAPVTPGIITPEVTAEQIAELVRDERVQATLPPQPLPQFIDTVFGQILEVPYSTGPGVSDRTEVVSLRGSVAMSKRAFFDMVQVALREYGVALSVDHGAVHVFRDQVLTEQAPLFVRERSLPSTASPSRPVIQFFELQSIEVNSLTALLEDAFPDMNRVRTTARQDINTLVISGNARDVASIAEIINQFDQPRFANAEIARVEPVYWSAQQLANAVVEVLATEGYQAARGGGGTQRAVTFLPIGNTNQLLLFSNLPEAFERALYWIEQLDRASALGDQEGVFVYEVQNTSAEELGRLVSMVGVENAGAPAAAAPDANGVGQQQAAQQQPANRQRGRGPSTAGRITVDPGGNRLLFRGTPSEFARTRDLLEQLDTPPRQVMVEMTIAEVTLSDETQFGIEWELAQIINGSDRWTGGTRNGLGLGASGLVLNFSHPDVRAALNAYAQSNNVNVLSTPRLVARSGGEAEIQVGTDVPIITSQQAADTQVGGNTDILQTVQYRRTGVILRIRPIVMGDGRVDIEISQEVSTAQSNSNAAIASPIILNRNVSTQISLAEGSTAIIGGLIQDAYSRGHQGIPVLKDLPLIGQAFRTDSVSGDRTELLILLTPYIVDDDELNQGAENFSDRMNRLLRRRGPHAYTLLPWTTIIRPTRVHGGEDIFEPPPARRHFFAPAPNSETGSATESAPAQANPPLGEDAVRGTAPDAETSEDDAPESVSVLPDPTPTPGPLELQPSNDEGSLSVPHESTGANEAVSTQSSAPASTITDAAILALRTIVESPSSTNAQVTRARIDIAALQGDATAWSVF